MCPKCKASNFNIRWHHHARNEKGLWIGEAYRCCLCGYIIKPKGDIE